MKTYLTLSAIALAAAATLSSGVVVAAEPTPDFTVAYNVGATSDYRVRGLKQNNSNPSVQGGIDVAHKSGFYVGIWGSTVSDWTAANSGSNMEVDYYGGYKTELAGVALDFGTIYYNYPGANGTGINTSDTREVYVGASYGPAAVKVSRVMSTNYFASTDGTTQDASGTMYYDLTLSQEVAPKLTASVHAGYTDYKNGIDNIYTGTYGSGKVSYADYNVGLTYDYEGYLLGVKYYINDTKPGTESYATTNGKKLYKDGFAVSILKAF
ncbi:MAG: hypothetical protein E6Q68_01355 [Polynucleobacter sp.]|nr:MAG: hypothetical protein E6Q68_01355 [Polynucleobacter sp.]